MNISFSIYPLSPLFVASKPQHSISDEQALKIEGRGNLIPTRKRDGYCTHVGKTNGRIELYSRTCKLESSRYPHLIQELQDLPIPDGTLFSCECIVNKKTKDGKWEDDFAAFTSIARSNVKQALMVQKEELPATLMPFNIFVIKNKDISNLSNKVRFDILSELLDHKKSEFIIPMEILSGSLAECRALVRENNWEGLVLYDSTKGTDYRLNGKFGDPPRPAGAYKDKPVLEGDFFVEEFITSTAPSHYGAVKEFNLLQYDEQGRKRDCGKCGIGITRQQRYDYLKREYPIVFEVHYSARFASSSLRHAKIFRERPDKTPEECRFPTDDELRLLQGTFKEHA